MKRKFGTNNDLEKAKSNLTEHSLEHFMDTVSTHFCSCGNKEIISSFDVIESAGFPKCLQCNQVMEIKDRLTYKWVLVVKKGDYFHFSLVNICDEIKDDDYRVIGLLCSHQWFGCPDGVNGFNVTTSDNDIIKLNDIILSSNHQWFWNRYQAFDNIQGIVINDPYGGFYTSDGKCNIVELSEYAMTSAKQLYFDFSLHNDDYQKIRRDIRNCVNADEMGKIIFWLDKTLLNCIKQQEKGVYV